MFTIKGKVTEATIMIDDVEQECISQIYRMINHPAFSNPIVIMPDTHSGKGSVIGFTMKMTDKVIPNVIGVDIGCGMLSYCIGDIKFNHEKIDQYVRDNVPFGKAICSSPCFDIYTIISKEDFKKLCMRIGAPEDYVVLSLGSLGGGNHFIEFGIDQNYKTWITVHSGSRYLGQRVGRSWQNYAVYKFQKEKMKPGSPDIEKIKKDYPKEQWNDQIKKLKESVVGTLQTDLEYLEGEDMKAYIEDMKFAQKFSKINREVVMNKILRGFGNIKVEEKIETIHNYIDMDDKIIRKGAIRSYVGEKIIIPFNMRDGILICEGKSNPSWNYSAPHGSGRILSRSKAKEVVNLDEFINSMKGIYSKSVDINTLDEAPQVYKDSKVIEEAIKDTVNIINRIIPTHNMKDAAPQPSWKEIRDGLKQNNETE